MSEKKKTTGSKAALLDQAFDEVARGVHPQTVLGKLERAGVMLEVGALSVAEGIAVLQTLPVAAMPDKWQSWPAAFDLASKLGASGDENRTARLRLSPADFRTALKSLDHDHE